jgi:hypothetical protein|tara:strand:- start:5746 stop:5958 length:213 start_codon:yes stop_codon:yes gene_type:complete
MTLTFGNRTSFHATVDDHPKQNMTVVKYWEGNEELFTNYVFNEEDQEIRNKESIQMAEKFVLSKEMKIGK